jgi:hypothetical protein
MGHHAETRYFGVVIAFLDDSAGNIQGVFQVVEWRRVLRAVHPEDLFAFA